MLPLDYVRNHYQAKYPIPVANIAFDDLTTKLVSKLHIVDCKRWVWITFGYIVSQMTKIVMKLKLDMSAIYWM